MSRAFLPPLAALIAFLPPVTAARAQVLVEYDFSDAPVISVAQTNNAGNNPSGAPNRASGASTVASGLTASDFTIQNPTGLAQVIAEAADATFFAAQISGLNNADYNFSGPYFQFTLTGVATLGNLTLNMRTGVEWSASNGALSSYASNRRSDYVLRWSVDNFTANITTPTAIVNGTFADYAHDLSSLDLDGDTTITFRMFTSSVATDFHRTQIQSVTLNGTAIPEPATAFGLCAGAGLLLLRRRGASPRARAATCVNRSPDR